MSKKEEKYCIYCTHYMTGKVDCDLGEPCTDAMEHYEPVDRDTMKVRENILNSYSNRLVDLIDEKKLKVNDNGEYDISEFTSSLIATAIGITFLALNIAMLIDVLFQFKSADVTVARYIVTKYWFVLAFDVVVWIINRVAEIMYGNEEDE